jgi:hypothetical protein
MSDLKFSADPLIMIEKIGCKFNESIWDTPFSKIPIIGLKSSVNPLGRQYRQACGLGEFQGKQKVTFLGNFSPMLPTKGPPLPEGLKISWPWKK